MYGFSAFLKRLFDLITALSALVLLSPLIFLTALVIAADSGFPVIFVQQRVGREGRPFVIFKFRTMFTGSGQKDFTVKGDGDPRLTRAGRFLRRSSLDELPQLLNVIRGDMSIVGPRPTLSYQVKRYNPRQMKRLSAKPGITGWAQVNGRNRLDWNKKIEMDLWYIDHYSFWLDLKIIFKTLKVVLLPGELYAVHKDDDISAAEKAVIIGAGGHGRVVAEILALSLEPDEISGFLDDDAYIWGQRVGGLPVLGGISAIKELCGRYPALSAVAAVGDNAVRKRIIEDLSGCRVKFIKALHPRAVVSGAAAIGAGTMVAAGAVINTGAVIGSHVIINTASTVEHDCTVGDFAHISPGAVLGGGVQVGEGAQVGIGATVMPGRKVGCWSVVGAGAVVVEDIPTEVVAVGVPARVVQNRRGSG